MVVDSSATTFEWITRTKVVIPRSDTLVDHLVGALSTRPARLVCEPEFGMPRIVGSTTIIFNITAVGCMFVGSRWGKKTKDIETEVHAEAG